MKYLAELQPGQAGGAQVPSFLVLGEALVCWWSLPGAEGCGLCVQVLPGQQNSVIYTGQAVCDLHVPCLIGPCCFPQGGGSVVLGTDSGWTLPCPVSGYLPQQALGPDFLALF